jgi:hypothetical protein
VARLATVMVDATGRTLSWATARSLLRRSLSHVVCYSKLVLVSPVRVAISKIYNLYFLKTFATSSSVEWIFIL